jgi:hypothetical protein
LGLYIYIDIADGGDKDKSDDVEVFGIPGADEVGE